jgi:hypothetical protein
MEQRTSDPATEKLLLQVTDNVAPSTPKDTATDKLKAKAEGAGVHVATKAPSDAPSEAP